MYNFYGTYRDYFYIFYYESSINNSNNMYGHFLPRMCSVFSDFDNLILGLR